MRSSSARSTSPSAGSDANSSPLAQEVADDAPAGPQSREGARRSARGAAPHGLPARVDAAKTWASFTSILDFGCGCGRVTRFLPRGLDVTGLDIDGEAIGWCRQNLSSIAKFDVNNPEPPLDDSDETFDLIFCVSVFTHLPLEMERAWLRELKRVLKPGGWLLISTLSDANLAPLGLSLPDDSGFFYHRSGVLLACRISTSFRSIPANISSGSGRRSSIWRSTIRAVSTVIKTCPSSESPSTSPSAGSDVAVGREPTEVCGDQPSGLTAMRRSRRAASRSRSSDAHNSGGSPTCTRSQTAAAR